MVHVFTALNVLLSLSLSILVFAHPAEVSAPCHTSTWRKLANAIIPKIWSVPTSQSPLDKNAADEARLVASQVTGRYARDVVLRFNLSSVDEALAIKDVADDLFLDIWEYTENWVDIRIAKDVVPSLLNLLPPSLRTSYAPLIHESALLSLITSSTPSSPSDSFTPAVRTNSRNHFFSDYQPLSVIHPWLRLLSNMFSTHTRLITIGYTHENRPIHALRIGNHPTNAAHPTARKTILVTAGAHAREWIATSSAAYLAWTLITMYGKSDFHTHLLTSFDWVVVPVTNPDGYEYTWSSDRLWRKNRQPTPLRFCNGVDIDRSYAFHFDSGAAGNPCAESYAGQAPWEAREARAMRAWARNQTENGTKFVAYLDLHSYSQQVLFPYAYSCDDVPAGLENLEELAFGLVKAMYRSKRGSTYRAGPACEGNVAVDAKGRKMVMPRLDTGGGSAMDWFYNELGVKYAYQIKLRDTGSYGFLLPKEQIVPTGKEVVAAAEWLGRFLLGEIGMSENDKIPQPSVHVSESAAKEGNEEAMSDDKGMAESKDRNPGLTRLEFRKRR